MKAALLGMALLLGLARCLPAQLNRATLTGVVSDPTGAAIVNSKITAIHVATNTTFSTATTEAGNYTLPALNIGEYRVEVEAPGFKRTVREGITLDSGASIRLDFVMELGAVTEAVQVNARAVSLETESTRVATSLTSKLVEDLPLVVAGQIRNVFNLALIAPEAKTGANTGGQFRIGGEKLPVGI